MIKKSIKYQLRIALLLCFLQVAGIDVYAQQPDSLVVESERIIADSLERVNQESLEKLEASVSPEIKLDSIPLEPIKEKKVWVPKPQTATWLAVIFPGGGQIYNRKYWKLPIIYGGFAGCAYALNWNNNMYRDYSKAYMDIMDGDPQTKSYYDFIRTNETIVEGDMSGRYPSLLKKRKDYYRRYRDISVFAFIGVYLLSIVDAYVDAELSNFDISDDISMRLEPTVINDNLHRKNNAVGLQCSFRF
ncbi:DUF5683 domain-containing protein [Bacteroides sp. 224]|uniref:DUF5683 domain-containing protein n=1 Tax=Bacteroides sp. 224 TaxID=2302936 RepID=UPI0013D024C0|nr:DUF5683 domain-containing protein [Bacteroides sp. 224]NDV66445.1 hypothetical protein [Bacteroides sp. 224]